MASSSAIVTDLLEERYVGKHATISCNTDLTLICCTATAAYIPMAEFMDLFEKAGDIISHEHITKCIYDERNLVAFHQPSMEWFYLVWMENMYTHNLFSYRRLVPEDKYFEQQMIKGKRKLLRENPWYNLEKYDILYCASLEEAINR